MILRVRRLLENIRFMRGAETAVGNL
jgi:hypothetical protein